MLVCFHDYTSPAAAVAVLRLQRLADAGLPVGFEGFEVLGVDAAIPPTLELLAQWERHRDDAAALGLELRRPQRQPPTLAAHVAGDVADRAGSGAAWRLACYRAYWEEGADLADPAVLREVARRAGVDPEAAARAAADRQLRTDTRRRMLARRAGGVGGVPVLDVGGTLVSGLLAEEELRQLAALG
jgi:predicted DsbA family dithiol-disulfide isomerase